MIFGFIAFTLIYIFLLLNRSNHDQKKDYLFGSRKIGVFPLVATLCVSQYGWINGVFEVYCLSGPKAWFILSLPYLLFNFLWIILGKYLHQKSSRTTPGLFLDHYGRKAQVLASIFLSLIFAPVMYLHMGADVLSHALQIDFKWSGLLFVLLTFLPTILGGFKQLVKVDLMLFIFTYVILIGVATYSFYNSSSSIIPIISSPTDTEINYIQWWLLALIVFIDPSIHQRLWAGNQAKSIKKIMSGALIFWILFDLLVIGIVVWNPDKANIFEIMQAMPQELNYFIYLFLFSVILSTANTYFNLVSNNFSIDIFNINPVKCKKMHLLIAILLGIICYALSTFVYAQSSVIEILFDLFPVAISALLIPFLGTLWPAIRSSRKTILIHMSIPALVCLFLQINPMNWHNFATSTPVAIGLVLSLLMLIFVKFLWQEQNVTKN